MSDEEQPKSPDVSDSESDADAGRKTEKKGKKLVVSDDEESDVEKTKTKKKKKKKKSSLIEDEASESEDAEDLGSDEDEDEDDEDENDYVNDGFVVDDVDEDHSNDESRKKHKRRRHSSPDRRLKRLKRKKAEEELDEEDYDLIKENLGIDEDEGYRAAERERRERERREAERRERQEVVASSKKDLEKGLFGEDDEESEAEPDKATADRDRERERERERSRRRMDEREEFDSDEMDDFIVDDDEEGDGGDGREERRPRPARPSMRRHAYMGGPSMEELDEAEELFGDMGDFFASVRQEKEPEQDEAEGGGMGQKKKSMSMKAMYEPSILRENLCTDQDEQIRQSDIPERFQVKGQPPKPIDPEERNEEAEWIFDQLQFERRKDRGSTVAAIESILKFYQDDQLEPIFVFTYRKEYYQPAGLRLNHLWDILDLDERWLEMTKRKKTVETMLQGLSLREEMDESQEGDAEPPGGSQIGEGLVERPEDTYRMMLESAFTEDELRDLRDYLQMGQGETDTSSTRSRRPVKRDFIKLLKKANIDKLCQSFALTATQLGRSLMTNTKKYIPKSPESLPEDFALNFVNADYFATEHQVLKAARHLLACEIGGEPQIRSVMRRLYRQNVTLSTRPTPKGRGEIDPCHYCHGLQYLERKPALHFLQPPSPQYLTLVKAEKEGFIVIEMDPPQEHVFLDILEPLFLDIGAATAEWDEQRRMILEEALRRHLLPSLEKELREELLRTSRESVAKEAAANLMRKLKMAPFRPADHKDTFNPGVQKDVRIMAFSVAADHKDRTFAAVVSRDGSLIDFKAFPGFRDRDLNLKVKEFLQDHRPHLVVVSTSSGMVCRKMLAIVRDQIRFLFPPESEESRSKRPLAPELCFLDDEVARIFSTSPRGLKEFPDYHPNLRLAIALARYAHNPASELSALWGTSGLDDASKEILFLNLHEHQDEVSPQMQLKEYERCFVEVINMAGVDLNHAANNEHAASQLQFICGLGSRKAMSLRQAVQRRGFCESRQDLVTHNMLGKTCYKNAAGFLRIRESAALREVLIDPLDDTRIHPESYFMAVKICGDASGNSDVDLYDPVKYQQVVEDVMFDSSKTISALIKRGEPGWDQREPDDKLSELDLNAYADVIEREYKAPKNLTISDIKTELRFPFRDLRRPFSPPSESELFFLLTSETPQSLQEGMIVTVKVRALDEDVVRVDLDSGLRGVIRKNMLTDRQTDFHLEDIVGLGQTMDAKVIRINMRHFEVHLSTRSQDLRDPPKSWGVEDPCFRADLAQADYEEKRAQLYNDQQEKEREGRGPKGKRKKRLIYHPAFQNFVSFKAAVQYLKEKPVGEAVFRPSSVGEDHLTLSWKVLPNTYVHVDVTEEDKENEDSLGKKLRIKDEIYEDLDEILARYITPMNDLVTEITRHNKFVEKSREDVQEILEEEKKREPARIPYRICYSDIPGYFSLSFLPGTKTVRHDKIKVVPDGLIYYKHGVVQNQKPFRSLNHLLAYFKKHFNDPVKKPERDPPLPQAGERAATRGRDRPAPYSAYDRERGSEGGGYSQSSDNRPQQSSYRDEYRSGGGAYSNQSEGERWREQSYSAGGDRSYDSRYGPSRGQEGGRGYDSQRGYDEGRGYDSRGYDGGRGYDRNYQGGGRDERRYEGSRGGHYGAPPPPPPPAHSYERGDRRDGSRDRPPYSSRDGNDYERRERDYRR